MSTLKIRYRWKDENDTQIVESQVDQHDFATAKKVIADNLDIPVENQVLEYWDERVYKYVRLKLDHIKNGDTIIVSEKNVPTLSSTNNGNYPFKHYISFKKNCQELFSFFFQQFFFLFFLFPQRQG